MELYNSVVSGPCPTLEVQPKGVVRSVFSCFSRFFLIRVFSREFAAPMFLSASHLRKSAAAGSCSLLRVLCFFLCVLRGEEILAILLIRLNKGDECATMSSL